MSGIVSDQIDVIRHFYTYEPPRPLADINAVRLNEVG